MGDATYTLRLDALELSMGLGIHPGELAAPQRVQVWVAMTCAYPARPADEIAAVVDYDAVRAGIHAIAAAGHVMLQEVLCDRIADLCLTDSRVIAVTVRSAKPDIFPDAEVGCEITRTR